MFQFYNKTITKEFENVLERHFITHAELYITQKENDKEQALPGM